MCLNVNGNKFIPEETKITKKAENKSQEIETKKEVNNSEPNHKDSTEKIGKLKQSSKFDPASSKIDFDKIGDNNWGGGKGDISRTTMAVGEEGQEKPMPIKKGDLEEILKKLKTDPVKVIEDIRNSKGTERDNGLLKFQNTIDKMGESQLKQMRDHLVREMASPSNKDDELLGALLNTVNKEIDSREGAITSGGIHGTTKAIGEEGGAEPLPFPIKPFPDLPDIHRNTTKAIGEEGGNGPNNIKPNKIEEFLKNNDIKWADSEVKPKE